MKIGCFTYLYSSTIDISLLDDALAQSISKEVPKVTDHGDLCRHVVKALLQDVLIQDETELSVGCDIGIGNDVPAVCTWWLGLSECGFACGGAETAGMIE